MLEPAALRARQYPPAPLPAFAPLQTVIDKDLLAILACPESHQTLSELSEAAVKELNECLASGAVKNTAGVILDEVLEGGLLREDKTVVYPIRDAIPVLLVEEGIPVADLGLRL